MEKDTVVENGEWYGIYLQMMSCQRRELDGSGEVSRLVFVL